MIAGESFRPRYLRLSSPDEKITVFFHATVTLALVLVDLLIKGWQNDGAGLDVCEAQRS